MKRLSALLALLLSSIVLAQPAQTTSNANLRAKPSTASQVLTVIPKGTVLDVSCSGNWCKVNGRTGYLAKSVLSLAQVQPAPALPAGRTPATAAQGQGPVQADSPPAGASAKCRDGTYSFSTHRRGTCSHHGGVDTWL